MSAIAIPEMQVLSQSVASAATRRPTNTPLKVLTFHIGAEGYGIDLLLVQEIRSYEQPTRLAGAPPFFSGVINLRDVIVPVIDLRLKFGIPEVRHDSQTVVVVLNVCGSVVGVVVDSVSDVLDLSADQIKPAPEFNHRLPAQHIVGIAPLIHKDGNRMLILLDIERLISADDMGLVLAPC